MNYYDTPEQPIDPPEMKEADETALDMAENILDKVNRLHDKVETFFEELTISQIEDIWADAEYYLEQIEEIYNESYIVEEEYNQIKYLLDDIEGWYNEKEDSIKYEDK